MKMLALSFWEKSSLQLFYKLIFRIIRKKSHVLLLKDTFQTWNDQSLEGNSQIIFSSLGSWYQTKLILVKCFNLFWSGLQKGLPRLVVLCSHQFISCSCKKLVKSMEFKEKSKQKLFSLRNGVYLLPEFSDDSAKELSPQVCVMVTLSFFFQTSIKRSFITHGSSFYITYLRYSQRFLPHQTVSAGRDCALSILECSHPAQHLLGSTHSRWQYSVCAQMKG